MPSGDGNPKGNRDNVPHPKRKSLWDPKG